MGRGAASSGGARGGGAKVGKATAPTAQDSDVHLSFTSRQGRAPACGKCKIKIGPNEDHAPRFVFPVSITVSPSDRDPFQQSATVSVCGSWGCLQGPVTRKNSDFNAVHNLPPGEIVVDQNGLPFGMTSAQVSRFQTMQNAIVADLQRNHGYVRVYTGRGAPADGESFRLRRVPSTPATGARPR